MPIHETDRSDKLISILALPDFPDHRRSCIATSAKLHGTAGIPDGEPVVSDPVRHGVEQGAGGIHVVAADQAPAIKTDARNRIEGVRGHYVSISRLAAGREHDRGKQQPRAEQCVHLHRLDLHRAGRENLNTG